MSTKDEIIRIIMEFPDNATIEDIMHQLYVCMKIEAGLKELDEGKGFLMKKQWSKYRNG